MNFSEWLKKRHVWLQRAAVKLMAKDSLNEEEIDDLVEICINEANGKSDIT